MCDASLLNMKAHVNIKIGFIYDCQHWNVELNQFE
jgi:hypothetical protein